MAVLYAIVSIYATINISILLINDWCVSNWTLLYLKNAIRLLHIFIITCGFFSFWYILRVGLLNHRVVIDLSLADTHEVFSKRLYQLNTLSRNLWVFHLLHIFINAFIVITFALPFYKGFYMYKSSFERYWNYFLLISPYFFMIIIVSFNEDSFSLLVQFNIPISSFEAINFGVRWLNYH